MKLVVRDEAIVDTPPSVEITVQNVGDQLVVTRNLVLVVQESLLIKECATEGNLPLSATYDLELPQRADPGVEFKTDINQEIKPNEADRFALKLRVPEDPTGISWSFYRLAVFIEVGLTLERVPIGSAVLALPAVPLGSGVTVWNERFKNDKDRLEFLGPGRRAEVETCLHDNSTRLKRFLSQPGERSPELRALERELR
ncbi:hypothetical protein ACN265_18785 [Micromonospora sp. WMMD730]|uniref:hypothetical protein n=1 Tax=Micromonospora sp. WMMD730 TaxID=3404128 RepID=UPI003B948F7C